MTPALELDGIARRFGNVEALVNASLRVRPGTVHALLGENGAGKSTLMRIAYGMLRPDRGSVAVQGKPVAFRSSADAIACRVGMVHQHFSLVPAMTVAENVSLGLHGTYRARDAAARVETIGKRTGLVLNPDAIVADLPVGAQQRLEIVKALARDVSILILDEPTAVLAPSEADELLRWIRAFVADGRSVVLITHKLREATAVADDLTILRRGVTVGSGAAREYSEPALVEALVGAPVDRSLPDESRPSPGDVVLVLDRVVVNATRQGAPPVLREVSLEVRAGEIVGVAAVEQSGQHELLRVLAGRLRVTAGSVIRPGAVGFVPEDRHADALVLDMTLAENVALHGLDRRRGQMPWRALHAQTTTLLHTFDVRAEGSDTRAHTLSGGNQQKLVLARELLSDPAALVVENPTRGLDIRASAAVHDELRRVRDRGTAVVLYSSDLDEVLALADRVVVMHAGRLTPVERSRDVIGRVMLGGAAGATQPAGY